MSALNTLVSWEPTALIAWAVLVCWLVHKAQQP
jgi:hypothetical protein